MKKIDLEVLANNLDIIKKNLPKYTNYPSITTAMLKKQSSIEVEFLDRLQQVRLSGYSETYAMYHNWYKTYKNIEGL